MAKKGRKAKDVRKVKYRKSKIEILARDVAEVLRIGGKTVAFSRDADTEAYVSPEAPYAAYASLEETARAIVDARRSEK